MPTQRHAVPRAEHRRSLTIVTASVRTEESAPLLSRAKNQGRSASLGLIAQNPRSASIGKTSVRAQLQPCRKSAERNFSLRRRPGVPDARFAWRGGDPSRSAAERELISECSASSVARDSVSKRENKCQANGFSRAVKATCKLCLGSSPPV